MRHTKIQGRLTIFLPSLAGGGAERAFVNVANGLVERNVEVVVVLASATGPYLDDLSPAVHILDLNCRSVVAAIPGLVQHLLGERPDTLLAAMNHANIAAALAWRLARSSARLVLSEQIHVSSLFAEINGLSMFITRRLMRLVYPWAARIVAISDGVAADLITTFGLDSKKITVIYNPVINQRLLSQSIAPPHHPWLLESHSPVILAIGRLVLQKDFVTLIRAFKLVRNQRPARLIIFGDGPLREELLALARHLGVEQDISLPGFLANPFSELGAADLFVLSSRFEGLANVLIEAIACGIPVVSTDCPSGPHEILEGGRWGQLVPIGDPAAMAKAIEIALDDPAPIDVRIRAKDFSYDAAIDRYAEVLGLTC